MEKTYAQALWKSVENGISPKEAVASLVHVLKMQGRAELVPRILRALRRLAEQHAQKRARIYVAHEKDARHALKKSGVAQADVCVDTSLIGGWRLESAETLVDTSFKKQLLDIYSKTTSAV